MQQVNVALNAEEFDRLQRILPRDQTVYSFAKDAILERIRLEEEKVPGESLVRPIVLEMAEALRERKWSLYQMEDYSDRNHKAWLEGRFRKATKTDILDAIAIFRTKASP